MTDAFIMLKYVNEPRRLQILRSSARRSPGWLGPSFGALDVTASAVIIQHIVTKMLIANFRSQRGSPLTFNDDQTMFT